MTHSGRWWFVGWVIAASIGCSDSHPDSGYGANKPVPATRTCSALCDRLADCSVRLCNENTSSSNYDFLESELSSQCQLNCTDAEVQSAFTAAQWSCTFTDSCRQVMEDDSCDTDASYTCD